MPSKGGSIVGEEENDDVIDFEDVLGNPGSGDTPDESIEGTVWDRT